jgi:DNA-binding MarR family transcriptional regulator
MQDDLPQRSALNDLMRECFRLNRSLLDVSQRLTEGTPLTGAQWGVLTAIAPGHGNEEPGTVAETARRMGLARQSVQRVTDVLAANGLVEYLPNPGDKRAKFVAVTPEGRTWLTELEQRQLAWVSDLVGQHSGAEIDTALRLIKDVRARISRQIAEDRLDELSA